MENKKEEFFIKSTDDKDIFIYCWDNVSKPKAVVQIFHGMAEHAARYANFAKYLNSKDIIVYANDHRGHGKTAGTVEELGCIGKDGFNMIIEDEFVIKNLIKDKYEGLPIIIFGHSFGSFVAQEFIIRYGKEIDGAIICGSAARTGPEVFMGKALSYIEKSIYGEEKKSKLLDSLSFNGYNKRIKNNQSKFDWLSCDSNIVKKYEEDPLCGTTFTSGFFYYFFKGMSILYKNERLNKIPKQLPIFIIAGSEDPVGNYGKLVKNLYDLYVKQGINNVEIKIYNGGRHELLNELNKDEVFSDLFIWINKVININSRKVK